MTFITNDDNAMRASVWFECFNVKTRDIREGNNMTTRGEI
jgi:hypothetical protein